MYPIVKTSFKMYLLYGLSKRSPLSLVPQLVVIIIWMTTKSGTPLPSFWGSLENLNFLSFVSNAKKYVPF